MTCAVVEPQEIREQCKIDALLESPPGLGGARPWDNWTDEAEVPRSPLNKSLPGDVAPPPGLCGNIPSVAPHENLPDTAWSPWFSFGMPEVLGQRLDRGPETILQATSLPCEDWKTRFGFAGHDLQDKWERQEPAVVQLSEASTTDEGHERHSSGSDDDPAYVTSGPDSGQLVSENEILSAENLRLAMENQMLRNASWTGAVNPGEMCSPSHWSSDGSGCSNMDMSWTGMHPFYGTPWPMMPMADGGMSMWHWGAAASPASNQKESRARTDSDVGRKRSGSARDAGRSRALSDVTDLHAVGEEFTGPYLTVMLRNLPNNYTRTMLLKLIDSEGFTGQYDFLYLPMDFKSHASLGYAFVNLVDPETATRFFEAFVGFHKWIVPSQKVCSVNWSAPYQGLEAHLERYRNSPVMHDDVPDDYKPMVFRDGERISFPPPTKKLKVPRMRVGHEKAILSESGSTEI